MNNTLNYVAESLTLWLWQASITFSLVTAVLLLSHRRLLTWFGARSLYPMWLLLPIALGIPALASFITPVLTVWLEPAQLSVWQSWTTMPGANTAVQNVASQSAWSMVIALCWLAPALVMVALFVRQYRQLGRQPSAVYRGLRVQWQPAGSSPGICGLLAPRLQLPVDFATTFNRTEQRLIIQHELTHWRRRDLQVNAFAWLLLSCQWFNPLAWLALRRFRADQEIACDASVLATQHLRRPQDSMSMQVCYANALLAAMQSVSINARPRSLWSTAACTHYGITQGEITMAQERFKQLNQRHQTRQWPAWVGASLVTLAGLAWLGPVTADSAAQHNSAEQASTIQPIVRIEPNYPADAAEQGVEGHVDLSFVINDEGRVTNIQVLDSQPADVFSAAAVSALQRWRFAPQQDSAQQLRMQFTLEHE